VVSGGVVTQLGVAVRPRLGAVAAQLGVATKVGVLAPQKNVLPCAVRKIKGEAKAAVSSLPMRKALDALGTPVVGSMDLFKMECKQRTVERQHVEMLFK